MNMKASKPNVISVIMLVLLLLSWHHAEAKISFNDTDTVHDLLVRISQLETLLLKANVSLPMQNLSNTSSESSQNHTNYYNWTMSTYNKIDKKNISMDIRNGQISISNTTMGTVIERNGSTILKSGATDSRWTYRLGHHSAHSCGVVDEKTKQLRPLRIIMGTSEKYIPVVLNWLIYFHIVCADRSTLYFLCLDKATELAMQKYGLQCSHVYHTSNSNNKLWLLRVRITKQLLDQGFDVLLSDSDAIWLRNPFATFDRFQDADIISSRASFPEDVSKILGSTLCMGFIYVKSRPITKLLWDELSDFMGKQPKPDDQRSINQLLLKRSMSYGSSMQKLLDERVAEGTFQIQGKLGRIALLTNSQFRRSCELAKITDIHKSTVVHCVSEKKGEVKEKAGKTLGIWAIRDDWQSVPFNYSTDDYLQHVIAQKHDFNKHNQRRHLVDKIVYPCPNTTLAPFNAVPSFSLVASHLRGEKRDVRASDRDTHQALAGMESARSIAGGAGAHQQRSLRAVSVSSNQTTGSDSIGVPIDHLPEHWTTSSLSVGINVPPSTPASSGTATSITVAQGGDWVMASSSIRQYAEDCIGYTLSTSRICKDVDFSVEQGHILCENRIANLPVDNN